MMWSDFVRARSACVLVLVCVWSVRTASAYEEEMTYDLDAVLSPQKTELEVRRWAPSGSPAPLTRCAALQDLQLRGTRVTQLPPRWVAACPHLQVLRVFNARDLRRLPYRLLESATELTDLRFLWGALEELPSDLLAYSPNLSYVDFSENSLLTLPSELFASCGALRSLYLGENKLQARALQALTAPALGGLTGFGLDGNPLSELCDSAQGVSKLSSLRNLQYLSLASTNITTICSDWRTLMPHLRVLNLRKTRVSLLRRADLEFVRESDSSVWLEGAPVAGVQLTESDYRSAWSPAAAGTVTVALDSNLQCSCSMYWTWRAVRDGRWPARVRVEFLRCSDGRQLAEHDLECGGAH